MYVTRVSHTEHVKWLETKLKIGQDLNRHFSQYLQMANHNKKKSVGLLFIKSNSLLPTHWDSSFKKKRWKTVWSHTCVIPALGRLGQELKISLENIANPCLKNKSNVHRPVCVHENRHTHGVRESENLENLEPDTLFTATENGSTGSEALGRMGMTA